MLFRPMGAAVPCLVYCFAQLLTTALQARAEACPVAELTPNSPVNSNLSRASCRYQDVVPNSTWGLNVQPFSLTVSTQGILTLDMTGSFDTNVYVFDKDFYRYEPDLEDPASLKPGNNSRLTVSLTPGTYLVLATSTSPGLFGDFTLKAGWAPPPNCLVEDLPTPGVVNSTLDQTDCRWLDIVAPSTSTERVKRYRVIAAYPGALDLQVATTAFVSELEVRDKSNVEINSVVSDFAVAATAMTVSLKPDTYLVYVSTNDGNLGAFSLTASFSGLRSCSPAELTLDRVIPQQAALDPSASCRHLDLVVPSADVSLVAPYSLRVDQPAQVQVDLHSNVFDSYVEVLDAGGTVLTSNASNGSNGNSASVSASLNPGRYAVLASTANYGSGAYTIRASSTDLRPCPGADAGSHVSGSLGGTNDCRVMDIIIPSSDATPVSRYNLQLSQKSAVRLQAASGDGTLPALGVYDAQLRFVNGASGNATSRIALLNTLLLPGEYTVLVSLAGGNAGGFSMDATVQQPRNCPQVELTTGAPVAGKFTKFDCAASDVLAGSNSSVPVQQFTFTAPAAGTLTLSAASADTTVVLKLVDASDVVLDSAVGRTSAGQIQVNVSAGAFKVFLLPWAGTEGSFQVQADFRPALAPPKITPIRNPGTRRRSTGF